MRLERAAETTPAPPSSTTAVLLVDDQECSLAALEAVFEGCPYDLVRARSGEEALRAVLDRDFAAVVLDVGMPGLDGFETARLLRERPNTRHLPILFQTSYDLDAEATARAYALGSVDLVTKPVRPEILRAKVDLFARIFERSREAAEVRARHERLAEERSRELGLANAELGVIADHLPVLISSVGKNERYIRVSRGYERWTGKPSGAFEGLTLRDVLGDETYRTIAPHVRTALAGREVTYEAVVDFGGARRHIRATYVPRRDRDGEVEGFVALVIDISDAKRAEAALRQSEAELSDFFENGAVGCHWIDAKGTILRVNRTELLMLGYEAEEFVGRDIADFHDDPAVIRDILDRLLRNEVVHDHPARLRAKDGSIRHALIDSSGLWKDGRFVHSRCFTRDVTGQWHDEVAASRLAAIVESSEDAIVGKTLDGVITSWNKGAERLFGYSSADVVGKHVTLLIPKELRSEEEEILARLRRGERVHSYETRRQAKNGRILDVSLSVSPIRDRQGRLVGAAKVARDISDRVRAEREIRRLNAELEDRVRERTAALQATATDLDAFAYTVSHDLRAPLRTMHRYCDVLLDEFTGRPLEGDGLDYLKRVAKSSRQMDQLIQDLLAFSRLGRHDVETREVCLDAVLKEALELLAGDILDRRARVELDVPLPAVRGDRVLVGQVLTNLLSNALRFTAPGVAPVVRVRAERRGAEVRVWVEDNGIGIAPEYHERIFRIFERLNPRQYSGTGVGLATAKRAMERMGGSLGLESDVDRGSRFWIQFPAVGA